MRPSERAMAESRRIKDETQAKIDQEARQFIHDEPRLGIVVDVLCGAESLKSPEHVAMEILRLVDSGKLSPDYQAMKES